MPDIKYTVAEVRAAGLQARWSRTRKGAPIIAARQRDGDRWYVIDRVMWERAQVVGIVEAFGEHTVLADIFSIRA